MLRGRRTNFLPPSGGFIWAVVKCPGVRESWALVTGGLSAAMTAASSGSLTELARSVADHTFVGVTLLTCSCALVLVFYLIQGAS